MSSYGNKVNNIQEKGRKGIGTNYYWFESKRKSGVLPEGGLHIGKCSCGWVFHFQAHQNLNLGTTEEFREFTKKGCIYDEYGDLIPYHEFWEIVESTRDPWQGLSPMSYHELVSSGAADYTNDGYMFTLGDFC